MEDFAILATALSVDRKGHPCPQCQRYRERSDFCKGTQQGGMMNVCKECQRNDRDGIHLAVIECVCCGEDTVPGYRLCACCSIAATRLGELVRLEPDVDFPTDAAPMNKPRIRRGDPDDD